MPRTYNARTATDAEFEIYLAEGAYLSAYDRLRDLLSDDRCEHNHAGVYLLRDTATQRAKILEAHSEAIGWASR